MLPSLLPALALGVPGSSHFISAPFEPDLPGSGLVVWHSLASEGASVTLLETTSVWDTRYGAAFRNVTGPLVAPATSELCEKARPEWAGHIVLGSDWTSPGCSMQTRARRLQEVGVLGVLFSGTEGTAFDCHDGTSAAQIPVAVMSALDYDVLADALASRNASLAWVTGTTSPLKSTGFQVIMRLLQVLAMVPYAINTWMAVKQLHSFGVCNKKRKLDKGPAVPVIACNLAANVFSALYTINAGPTMEAAVEPILPFLAGRLLIDLGFELHMIGTLLLSAHFRKICAGIEKMVNGEGGKTRPSKRRSSVAKQKNNPRRASINEEDLANADTNAPAVRWDLIFIFAVGTMILLQFTVAVLQGLFSLLDMVSMLVWCLIAFVTASIGLWFRHYANKVVRMMSQSTSMSQALLDRIARLSRNVSRVGNCLVTFVVVSIVQEMLRIVLRMFGGGWTYWGTLCPIWFVLGQMMTLSIYFQIIAFQATEPKKEKAKTKPTKMEALENSSEDLAVPVVIDVNPVKACDMPEKGA